MIAPDRLYEVFRSVTEASDEDREALLAHLCGDDSQLEFDVRELLRAAGAGGHWFDATINSLNAPEPTDPAMIGPFRLVRLIGQGGFGRVYLAEQEQPVSRRVAIKLMHHPLLRNTLIAEDLIDRFRREQTVLAAIEHPSIARLIDAGELCDGRPYFIMEYVEGSDLMSFAIRHDLSACQRIVLVMDLCDAVLHAHHKGIIHRDLKPGNVLVEPDALRPGRGRVKVIDFGIAALTSDGESTLDVGMFERVGTPGYRDPHRGEGGSVADVRTDVYAIGVVVEQLLACEKVRRGMSRQQRGEIDAIIARATADHPAARYNGVNELHGDLRAWIEKRPVSAYARRPMYVARKWVGRNPWWSGTLAGTVTCILALTLVAEHYRRQAMHRLDASQRAFEQTLHALDRAGQHLLAIKEAPKAVEFLREAALLAESTWSLNEPQARILKCNLAIALEAAGDNAEAERVLRELLPWRIRLDGDNSRETAIVRVHLVRLLGMRGEAMEREQVLRDLLRTRGEMPDRNHAMAAIFLGILAEIVESRGDLVEAERVWRLVVRERGLMDVLPDGEPIDAPLQAFHERTGRAPRTTSSDAPSSDLR